MRTPHDTFSKLILSLFCENAGEVATELEVEVSPRRIDLVFRRDPHKTLPGILDRMFWGFCIVEFYQSPPEIARWRECIQKQVALQSKKKEEYPMGWVISAGKPVQMMKEAGLRQMDGWPRGFYEGAEGLRLRLVVVSELPPSRETLVLRLLGKPARRNEAIRELLALDKEEMERKLVGTALAPFLLALRKEEGTKMIQPYRAMYERWAAEQQEIGMEKGREEGMEKGMEKGREEGMEKGRKEGIITTLLDLYRLRFSDIPPELPPQLEALSSNLLQSLVIPFAKETESQIQQRLSKPS